MPVSLPSYAVRIGLGRNDGTFGQQHFATALVHASDGRKLGIIKVPAVALEARHGGNQAAGADKQVFAAVDGRLSTKSFTVRSIHLQFGTKGLFCGHVGRLCFAVRYRMHEDLLANGD